MLYLAIVYSCLFWAFYMLLGFNLPLFEWLPLEFWWFYMIMGVVIAVMIFYKTLNSEPYSSWKPADPLNLGKGRGFRIGLVAYYYRGLNSNGEHQFISPVPGASERNYTDAEVSRYVEVT